MNEIFLWMGWWVLGVVGESDVNCVCGDVILGGLCL